MKPLPEDGQPSFSLVVCNYNYGRFVGQAISSCITQTYPRSHFEVIVVDDGSTDDSRARIDSYLELGNVRAVFQSNQGQAAAFAAGIDSARGEFVCLLDSDDFYLPDKLEAVAERLRTLRPLPDELLLCHDLWLHDEERGQRLDIPWFNQIGLPPLVSTLSLAQSATEFPFAIPCGQVYSRKLIRRLSENLPLAQWRMGADYAYAQAAFLSTREQHLLRTPLAVYRIHGANDSATIVNGCYRFRQRKGPSRGPAKLRLLEAVVDSLEGDSRVSAERIEYVKRIERTLRYSSPTVQGRTPLVSLLVFDRADNEALQRTLESALASVYGTIEIVVIPKDSESLAGRIPRHVIKHVRACRLRAQATGFERLATAWREARGQYAVILGAGDCLDPYFVEHHLFVQRGYAPCTISSCTSQWIEADANTTVRSITGSEAAGAVSPLCDWPFGPLAANMVARTRHVDLLFDAMQPDKATGFAHASGWLLLQYARAIGTLSRFDECLLRYSASDGSAVPWALPGDARDGSEKPDHAMTASVILSIVCANLDTFEKVFARAWQGQLASWLARGQTSASLGALAAIARSSGALIATQVLEKALYAHSLDLRNSE